MSIIRMENVKYQYKRSDKEVLKSINLSVEEGETIAIVGRSGSGKSTLLKCMRGFIPYYISGKFSGQVYFRDKKLSDYDLGGLTRSIGYVFENSFIYETSGLDTVYDELEFPLENLGLKKNMMIVRVEKILKYLEIYDLRYRNPKDLSPGERQILSLAAVVAMDADVIILDEPTSTLNKNRARLVIKLLKDLKKLGKTIIVATKSLDHIGEVADKVLVLDNGIIALDGDSEDIFMNNSIGQYGIFPPEYINIYKKLLAEGIPIERIPMSTMDLELQLKKILEEVV